MMNRLLQISRHISTPHFKSNCANNWRVMKEKCMNMKQERIALGSVSMGCLPSTSQNVSKPIDYEIKKSALYTDLFKDMEEAPKMNYSGQTGETNHKAAFNCNKKSTEPMAMSRQGFKHFNDVKKEPSIAFSIWENEKDKPKVVTSQKEVNALKNSERSEVYKIKGIKNVSSSLNKDIKQVGSKDVCSAHVTATESPKADVAQVRSKRVNYLTSLFDAVTSFNYKVPEQVQQPKEESNNLSTSERIELKMDKDASKRVDQVKQVKQNNGLSISEGLDLDRNKHALKQVEQVKDEKQGNYGLPTSERTELDMDISKSVDESKPLKQKNNSLSSFKNLELHKDMGALKEVKQAKTLKQKNNGLSISESLELNMNNDKPKGVKYLKQFFDAKSSQSNYKINSKKAELCLEVDNEKDKRGRVDLLKNVFDAENKQLDSKKTNKNILQITKTLKENGMSGIQISTDECPKSNTKLLNLNTADVKGKTRKNAIQRNSNSNEAFLPDLNESGNNELTCNSNTLTLTEYMNSSTY